jgi:hypothetical protein
VCPRQVRACSLVSDYADADASASALTSLVTQKDDATLPCVVGLSFLQRVTTTKIDLANIKVSAVASSANAVPTRSENGSEIRCAAP